MSEVRLQVERGHVEGAREERPRGGGEAAQVPPLPVLFNEEGELDEAPEAALQRS